MSPLSPHPSLRPWRRNDLERFQALHADPTVASFLGGALSAEEAEQVFQYLTSFLDERGWGVWVVQNEQGELVGAAGLEPVRGDMPFAPAVEATWRLLPEAWGKGLITTTMKAVLADGFERLTVSEIVAFTAMSNTRSQGVMGRLGFRRDPARDFVHPSLGSEHPLRAHLFYALPRHDSGPLRRAGRRG